MSRKWNGATRIERTAMPVAMPICSGLANCCPIMQAPLREVYERSLHWAPRGGEPRLGTVREQQVLAMFVFLLRAQVVHEAVERFLERRLELGRYSDVEGM